MDPTLNGNENAGSENETQMDEARQARRRLLKLGAATAPLVLTFKPSSAWAVSAGCELQTGKMKIPGPIMEVDVNYSPSFAENELLYRYNSDFEVWEYRFREQEGDEPYEWYDLGKGPYTGEHFKMIEIEHGHGEAVTADNIDRTRLRSLVFNDNMGMSCLSSILTSA